MNWLDAVLLAAGGLWALRCYRRGFVSAVFELGGVALGLWLGTRYAQSLAVRLNEFGGVPTWLGRPTIFAALLLPVAIIGHWAGNWAAEGAVRGSVANRVAGAIVGLAEGALVAGVALVAWVQWGGSIYASAVMDSRVADWLLAVMPVFYAWLAEVLAW